MRRPIKIALVGVGNCASSIVQGLVFYSGVTAASERVPGLIHHVIGGYTVADIKIVAAFDIDKNKVGKDVADAIFVEPNSSTRFAKVKKLGVKVSAGCIGDGIAREDKKSFKLVEKPKSVAKVLGESRAEIAIIMIPTGSKHATRFYASACLEAGVAPIVGIPEFIASDPRWVRKFEKAGLPCAGDDVMSQFGATFLHLAVMEWMLKRGHQIAGSAQTNYGNNRDFENLMHQTRITSKSISKASPLEHRAPWCRHIAGPGAIRRNLKPDQKLAIISIEGRQFGGVRQRIDIRNYVEDSPDFAGPMLDAIRLMRLSLDRGLSGYQDWSAYYFKHPLRHMWLADAERYVENFILGRS